MMQIFPVRGITALCLAALCLLLPLAGCRKHAVQAAPSTPLPTESKPPDAMAPPTVSGPPEKMPPNLTVPTPAPPPPRTRSRRASPPEPDPAATEPASPKPEPPRISPRYTAAEEAAFREQTNRSITKAEGNLQRVSGRRLNAAQNDMAEKIRGFLGQAREAAQAGDWFRAQNLANKAEVLSQELVNTR